MNELSYLSREMTMESVTRNSKADQALTDAESTDQSTDQSTNAPPRNQAVAGKSAHLLNRILSDSITQAEKYVSSWVVNRGAE